MASDCGICNTRWYSNTTIFWALCPWTWWCIVACGFNWFLVAWCICESNHRLNWRSVQQEWKLNETLVRLVLAFTQYSQVLKIFYVQSFILYIFSVWIYVKCCKFLAYLCGVKSYKMTPSFPCIKKNKNLFNKIEFNVLFRRRCQNPFSFSATYSRNI